MGYSWIRKANVYLRFQQLGVSQIAKKLIQVKINPRSYYICSKITQRPLLHNIEAWELILVKNAEVRIKYGATTYSPHPRLQ